MPYQNSDGLTIKNPQDLQKNINSENTASSLRVAGAKKQIEIDVNFKKLSANGGTNFTADLNNDNTLDGFFGGDVYLPANASVLSAIFVTSEAAAGGTSFTVGTRTVAGAAIADTGLITATEGVLANINAAGKRLYGAGSLVSTTAGTAGVGTADAYIYIATTGTFTAGKGRLIIEYIDPLADA
jgi:hypothetical protein